MAANANLLYSTGADSAEIEAVKCTVCRGELEPYPKESCALLPAMLRSHKSGF